MKKYLLVAVAALLLSGYSSIAQQQDSRTDRRSTSKKEKKLKEYDEIIIKRKDAGKDAKISVEIKDDQVFIDGKPVDDYVNDVLSVRLKGQDLYRMNEAVSAFRGVPNGGNWNLESDDDQPKAFLGVLTEGSASGTKVKNVSPHSPAERAGLKAGDILTKINDKSVFDHEQLVQIIAELNPDDKISIRYNRDGKENTTTAALSERPSVSVKEFRGAPMPPDGIAPPMSFDFRRGDLNDLFSGHPAKPRLGIKVQDTEDGNGVKVLEVEEGSPADKAGIQENDIVTLFEGKAVNTAEELAQGSREARNKSVMKVQLKRNGKAQTIELKVPRKLKTAEL